MKKKSLLIVAILTFVLSFAFAACGGTETPHTHEYTAYEWVEGSTPTETEAGKATATCATCGESTTVDVPKLTDESVWTVTITDATCTEDGEKTYTSKYGTVKVAIAASHKFGDLVAAKAATCETAGNVAYYHCTVCDKNFAEDGTTELTDVTIPLADHDYGTLIEATASTCKEHGTVAHYTCSVCKKNFDADKHELSSIEAPLADHDYGTLIEATASTCKEHGTVAHYTCSVCKKNFDADKRELSSIEAPLADHVYGELVEETESTCQTQGHIAYYQCSVCENYFNADKEAVTAEELKKPLGDHNFGEWQKGDENGHTRACQTEGCTVTETVAHDYTGQGYYPGGTEEHYTNCKVCRYEHFERHTFGDWVKKDETNHAHKCTACQKEITEAHTGGTATCKDLAICSVCNEPYGDFAEHTLGEDGVCTVCGKTPNAVFGKTYSAFTVNASGVVSTSVNALLTFDSNGKAEGVTGSVSIIKRNGEYEDEGWDDTEYYKITDSSVYIRYIDKEKGTVQFVSSYMKATKSSAYGKYGTPKLTETTYPGYISKTNGFIFIPQGYGSSIVLVPTETAVTSDVVAASAFNSKGDLYGVIFFKYTGTEAESVYYNAKTGSAYIGATVTDFDGAEVVPTDIKTAPAMIVKDKDGNVLAKYGYDEEQVVALDEWAGKYTGNLGEVTVWGNGKITTELGDGTYTAVVADDHNIEVIYNNADGDVTAYYEISANKADHTYTGDAPTIVISYNLGDYGESYEDDGYKKVTFTLPEAPVSTNELYMFGGWAIGSETYEAGAKVSADADVTITAIWKQKVKITIVDGKNAGGNDGKIFYAGAEDELSEVLSKNVTTVLEGEEFKYYAIDGKEIELSGVVGEDNLTITVVWKEKYVLTIVYGNGLENGTETYFEGYVTNPAKPSFTNGQAFDGWFTDADCTVAYTPAALTDNFTIYAKWKTAAVPFVGTSYALSVSGLKDTTYNDVTLYGDSRYYFTVDANGLVTDSDSTTFKNKSITFDSATNTFTINGYTGKYFPEQQAFALYKYNASGVRNWLSVYFLDATAIPLVEPIKYSGSTNAYQYNNAKYLFLKASVTRNGETTPLTMFVDEDNFYFDVVVEKGTKSGDTYNYTELTSFSSMSIPDQVKVYNADKSTLIATLGKPSGKYTLYKALGIAGEYTATVDGVASEDKVVLDDYGINITFGSLSGTYTYNSTIGAYDVYLNSKKVYYAMTIDVEAKTATLVKEMVTISFELNTVSGVDMGTFASVSVNKNVYASLSDYKPTKDGYAFKGWYTTAELTTSVSSLTPTENVTVYAKWAKACTVSFETAHGVAPDSIAKEEGETIYKSNFPTLTDETGDYTFKGWYVKGDETQTVVSDANYTVNANVTFVAKWLTNVSITIVSGIDGLDNKVVKVCPGDEFDLKSLGFGYYKTDAMEKGKIVSGYYTDAECTDGNEFTATSVTESTTIYAKWVESEPYEIQMAYYSEAGKGKGSTSSTDSSKWYSFVFDATEGCWKSTNQTQGSTMSSMKIVAYGTLEISFKYSCGGEKNYDILYVGVTKDGKQVSRIAYESNSSSSPAKKDATITLNAGECLEFVYSKDSGGNQGDDSGKIYDLTINGTAVTEA